MDSFKDDKVMNDLEDIKIEEVLEPNSESNPKEENYGTTTTSDNKTIIIMIVIIGGLFIAAFGGFSLYNNLSGSAIINIDDLHQENLNEELNDEEGYIYNGYSFVKVDGLWWTEMNKFGTLLKVPLHFGPRELEDIPLEGDLDLEFNLGEEIYIAMSPFTINKYYSLAISEFSINLVKGMDRIPVGSCTEENPEVCEDRPVINCENTEGKPVVELVFEPDMESRIDFDGTCIKISGGTDYGIVKTVDRLLYEWYGVMDSSEQ